MDIVTDRARSIHQLDFERRWLTAQLDHGAYFQRTAELEAKLRRIEDLDLIIASKSAADIGDLVIKLERLAQSLMPELPMETEASLEAILMNAVLADARRLARAETNPD